MSTTPENAVWTRFYPEGVTATIAPLAHDSIGAMVRATAARFGDASAFSNLGAALSFREVDRLSDAIAANLLGRLGLQPGDRIAIQMPNLLQYPVVLYGALKAGLVVVNLNPLYTETEMRRVIEDAKPRAIVVLANFADKVERILPGSSLEHVIVTHVGDLLPQPKRTIVNLVVKRVQKLEPAFDLPAAIALRSLLRAPAGAKALPAVGLDDIAFLQYTGGTTGGVKAAVLTHRNLLSNQAQFIGLIEAAFDAPNPVVIAALPLYHVFSLTVNCFGFFLMGAENVLVTNPRDIPGFVKTLRESRPHGIILVSTLAGALLESKDFAALDFSRLRITVAGGMAVRTAVAEHWREVTGQDIIEGYGLTEASPVVSVNPPHLPVRVGTIGVPLPSTEVEIRDDDGRPVGLGEPGELAVRGPQVMREYWGRPEATAEVLTEDGWLLTGDMATIDEDGYLRIVDRKKELIVVSGFNVYPSEIEDAAMLHPGVAEAGVVGIPDDKAGEVPKLFVVKRDPALTADELRAYLAEHLTNYKRPREIVFRDELPKTNVGKVLRRELREL